jgi:hypothetical protein
MKIGVKKMNNQVNLTDDELSVIVTSLQMTLMSVEQYEKENVLDFQTQEVKKEMKSLHERLREEYF